MNWPPPAMQDLLIEAAWQTLLMVGASGAVAVLLGLPLALLLLMTAPDGLSPNARHPERGEKAEVLSEITHDTPSGTAA